MKRVFLVSPSSVSRRSRRFALAAAKTPVSSEGRISGEEAGPVSAERLSCPSTGSHSIHLHMLRLEKP